MTNEEVIRMLEAIERQEFCEDVERNHCREEDNCTECMVSYCKNQLKQGKIIKI